MKYFGTKSIRGSAARSVMYLVLSLLVVAALVPGSALLGLAGMAHATPAMNIPPAFVHFSPVSQAIPASGTATVQINISHVHSQTNDPTPVPIGLYGAAVHLGFDPSLFQVVDVDPAIAGVQITPVVFGVAPANFFVAQNHVDNVAGTIDFAITLLDPQTPMTGGGTLASVNFQGLGTGVSALIVNTSTLVGVVNFGTTNDIVTIPSIPMPGWLIEGQVPTHSLTVATTGSGNTIPGPTPHPFAVGTEVKVAAFPSPGATFLNWTGGVVDPAAPVTSVIVDADVTVTANFTQGGGETYTLTMVVNPPGSGTTTPTIGAHTGYAPGTVVDITAAPAEGYTFVNWSGPVVTPNNPSTTVIMGMNLTVTANFTQGGGETCTLTMAVNGGGNTTPGVGPHTGYAPGTVVNITASPTGGWNFVNWTTSVAGSVAAPNSPSTTVIMNTDVTVTANFTQTYTLTMAVNGIGSTTPGVGPHTGYTMGTVVNISAAPADGWTFVNWSGPVTDPTSPSTTVIMDMDKIVIANFTQGGGQTYTLTMAVNPAGSGTTTPAVGPHTGYAAGTAVNISTAASEGWTFVSWTGPVAEPADDTTTVTVNSDVIVTANFSQSGGADVPLALMPATNAVNLGQDFNVTINTNVAAGVQVDGVEAFINFDPAFLEVVDTDAGVAGIQIAPGATLSTVLQNTVDNVTGHVNYSAGILAGSAAGPFVVGTINFHTKAITAGGIPTPITISLVAPRASGVFFNGNPVNGPHANSSATISVAQTYTLTMAVDPAGSGTTAPVVGPHTGYAPGSAVSISAAPTGGWDFVNWTTSVAGSVADVNAPSTTVTVNSDTTVTANFAQQADAPLSLLPASNNVTVGQVFNVTINTNVAAGQQVSAVDAFVNFDPAKLEVVDADGDTAGIQIAFGSQLPMVLNNVVDNVAGHIDFSAGKLSGFPSGPFLVATISFRAKAESGATPTPIEFSLSGTRTSIVALSGSSLPGTHANSSAAIIFDTPLSLLPANNNVLVGQVFPVTINTTAAAGTQISAVDAFINFNPALLEVVDADPANAGIQIGPGTDLPTVLGNTVDNTTGHIDFSSGKLSGTPPAGSFLVGTINFRAKAETAGTAIVVSLAGARQSLVAYSGTAVPGTHANSAAVITFDTPLSLLPAGGKAYVGVNFNMTINTNAPAGTSISAVDAFIDFDPAYLEVVDSDPATPGVQVAPGSSLPSVLNNAVDNGTGHIDFSAGKLSGTPPDGSFLVATITFHAKAETPGMNVTPITVSLAGARKSLVAFGGNPVPGAHANAGRDIDPGATIIGQLTLQGGSRPAAARAVPITVKLFNAGAPTGSALLSATPVATYTPTTVDTGSNNVTFQIDGVIAGTYDIMIVTGHTLHNVKRNVLVAPPTTTVIFGTMLEGNSNNDGIINAIDFSILAASYLKSSGTAGFDARADYDMNAIVNALDFSLLAANYLKFSPLEQP